jgi:ATPase
MVGVIHATSPIDSVQRFIGRLELGVIPSVIDTVIFIDRGEVKKVYELETSVKIPYGLTEADLTRPVVLVKNFQTGSVDFEIYVFGERTFVVPVRREREGQPPRPRNAMLSSVIGRVIGKFVSMDEVQMDVTDREVTVYVPPQSTSLVIRKCRKRLQRIEEKMGIRITIRPLS